MEQAAEAAPVRQPAIDALRGLCAIARLHQVGADPHNLAHQLGLSPAEALQAGDLTRAARHLGLQAKPYRTTPERLSLTPLPALARLRESGRWVVLAQCDGERVLVQDIAGPEPAPMVITRAEFAQGWDGELVLLASRASDGATLAQRDVQQLVDAMAAFSPPAMGEVRIGTRQQDTLPQVLASSWHAG